jgi:citrate lyase beta subunit
MFLFQLFFSQKSHVDAINSGYAPSQTQAERAFKIVSAFVEAGTSAGRGSLMVDGQMVDVPVCFGKKKGNQRYV